MVTLAEVAQRAGVSASTVSYVLSGKRSISTTTRQRVEESIRKLGYHPNAGARALASSRSNIIALMIPPAGPSARARTASGSTSCPRAAHAPLACSNWSRPRLSSRPKAKSLSAGSPNPRRSPP
ncbi:HTH-type transcriptional repressor PurR [Streptomyces tendae]